MVRTQVCDRGMEPCIPSLSLKHFTEPVLLFLLLFVCLGIKIKGTELGSVHFFIALCVCSSLASPTRFMSSLRTSTRA